MLRILRADEEVEIYKTPLRRNDRRGLRKRGQIIAPSILAAELIVQDRAWRVDMRFPSPPL